MRDAGIENDGDMLPSEYDSGLLRLACLEYYKALDQGGVLSSTELDATLTSSADERPTPPSTSPRRQGAAASRSSAWTSRCSAVPVLATGKMSSRRDTTPMGLRRDLRTTRGLRRGRPASATSRTRRSSGSETTSPSGSKKRPTSRRRRSSWTSSRTSRLAPRAADSLAPRTCASPRNPPSMARMARPWLSSRRTSAPSARWRPTTFAKLSHLIKEVREGARQARPAL
mmetsp:Transcript_31409/g.100926  ORF Transcript_31409/g.100926 Transcript_31409/m.100926 type:complete len:228 (-) Transcript_31409:72-755(-)